MKILWSPLAAERVSEIAEYIAEDNPSFAERWVENVFQKIEELKVFPERGRFVPELNNNTVRELIYGNYRIIYRLEGKRLSVLTVRHGKQMLPLEEIVS
jgi:plasmid stabilization system protein ParE